MLLFSLLLCFGKSKDNINEISFTDVHVFKMQLDERQERSIFIDQNYITTIFDLVDDIQIEAFVVRGNSSYSIGKMDKNNKRYALHSGSSLICFKITSFTKTEYTFHMIRDNKKCNKTFISTRINEKFTISDKHNANVTVAAKQKICLLHSPKGTYKYQNAVFDSSKNFKLKVYQGNQSPENIEGDIMVGGEASGETFFIWRTFESDSFPIWSYSTKGVETHNSFSINYENSDELKFITPNGFETPTIDLNRPFTMELAPNTQPEESLPSSVSTSPTNKPQQIASMVETPQQTLKLIEKLNPTASHTPSLNGFPEIPENIGHPEKLKNEIVHKNQNHITIDISMRSLLIALIIVLVFLILVIGYAVFCYKKAPEAADEIGLLSQPYRDEFGYSYPGVPASYYPVYGYQATPQAFAPGA